MQSILLSAIYRWSSTPAHHSPIIQRRNWSKKRRRQVAARTRLWLMHRKNAASSKISTNHNAENRDQKTKKRKTQPSCQHNHHPHPQLCTLVSPPLQFLGHRVTIPHRIPDLCSFIIINIHIRTAMTGKEILHKMKVCLQSWLFFSHIIIYTLHGFQSFSSFLQFDYINTHIL